MQERYTRRIKILFIQKNFTYLSKMWVWDLGSGKKNILDRIPDTDPGDKKALEPRARIRIRSTALFCLEKYIAVMFFNFPCCI